MMQTGRRHPRVQAPVRVHDLGAEPPETMMTRNIGLGGMFLFTPRPRPVGSTVQLLIEHRDRKLPASCRVTHAHADGIGVAFVGAGEELLEVVQSIIDELLARPRLDRRAGARAPAEGEIVWSHAGEERPGILKNASVGGALIESAAPPATGADVFLYLPGYTYAVTSDRPSEARGCAARVVHVTDGAFGVDFVSPSAEFRMAIEALRRAGAPGGSRA